MVGIVGEFVARHPRVRVGLRALSTEAITHGVLSGDFGLGLGFNMTPVAGLRSLMTLEIPFGAVVAPGHPLAEAKRVRLANAAQFPLVLAEPKTDFSKQMTAIAKTLCVAPATPKPNGALKKRRLAFGRS